MTMNELPKTAKLIEGSKDYIDLDGSVYTYRTNYKGRNNGKVVRKAYRVNQGYIYCGIYSCKDGKCHAMRVHRLVAKAFIPNPHHYLIVGHKNNIKTDNRVENLYWTTNEENVQRACDDGLLKNDKGYDDSQSKPVIMYETTTNRELKRFGSCREAHEETNIPMTTICRQAKYGRPVRKPYYFRYADDETAVTNRIIGKFDFETDRLIETYYNTGDAARSNHIAEKVISQQCHLNRKPNFCKRRCYFSYINSDKCEQTIESEMRVE